MELAYLRDVTETHDFEPATKSRSLVHHNRCANEQVQNIGRVQSHGVLFALSEADFVIRHVSTNVAALLDRPAESFLGLSFEAVLGAGQVEGVKALVATGQTPVETLVWLDVARGPLKMNCVMHRQGGVLFAELELLEGAHSLDPIHVGDHLKAPLAKMETAPDVAELSYVVAGEIRKLSGFGRVMIYRFDSDWNGEVIAESMSPSPVSYQGLRFPAGDIPPQVRRLFLINPFRAIADIDAPAFPVIPEGALDLTRSVLRSAAPIHIEYLRNMGVQSSMTISIIVEHQLWGLIACHDAAPRRVDHSTRAVCELIAQSLSSQISSRLDNGALQSRLTSRKLLEEYMGSIETSTSLADAEHLQSPRLLDLFAADGLVCRTEDTVSYRGVTETEAVMLGAIEKLRGMSARGIASTNMLGELDPQTACYASNVSGALYLGLREGSGEYLLLLRRELVATVNWAGNPNEAVSADEKDRLHPRSSFAAWTETVQGFSRPWTALELENAAILREQLLRVRDAQKLAILNEALAAARAAQAAQLARADMACTVLHDIGNAITGIGTRSAQLLAQPAWPETENLSKMSSLLQSQLVPLGAALGERRATALSGLTSALERNLREREAALREQVRSLVNSVSHVQDILSVERQHAQQGSRTPRAAVVLSELLNDAMALQAAGLEKRAVQLTYQIAPNLPRLRLDRTRMVQVLGNMIRNACESFDGVTDKSAPRQLKLSAQMIKNDWVTIELKDNGCGFPPENASKIFQRGHTTKSHGSGIGLSSCRSTVESHGGRMWINSEGAGKGATVIVELPTDQDSDKNAR